MNLSINQKVCLQTASAWDHIRLQETKGKRIGRIFFKRATILSLIKHKLLEETGYFKQYHLTFAGKKVVRKFRKDWSHVVGDCDNELNNDGNKNKHQVVSDDDRVSC